MLQYPYGHLAHGYVLEEFRGKGLNTIVGNEMCDRIFEGGDLPECIVLKGNTIARHLILKAGWVEMFQDKGLSIGRTNRATKSNSHL